MDRTPKSVLMPEYESSEVLMPEYESSSEYKSCSGASTVAEKPEPKDDSKSLVCCVQSELTSTEMRSELKGMVSVEMREMLRELKLELKAELKAELMTLLTSELKGELKTEIAGHQSSTSQAFETIPETTTINEVANKTSGTCTCTKKSFCMTGRCKCRHVMRRCSPSCSCLAKKCKNRGDSSSQAGTSGVGAAP